MEILPLGTDSVLRNCHGFRTTRVAQPPFGKTKRAVEPLRGESRPEAASKRPATVALAGVHAGVERAGCCLAGNKGIEDGGRALGVSRESGGPVPPRLPTYQMFYAGASVERPGREDRGGKNILNDVRVKEAKIQRHDMP
jgi:hypothetical protein